MVVRKSYTRYDLKAATEVRIEIVPSTEVVNP